MSKAISVSDYPLGPELNREVSVMRGTVWGGRSRALGVTFLAAAACLCTARGEEPSPAKATSTTICTVELDLPDGARVTVDGKSYDTLRTLTFRNLAPGKSYKSRFEVTFPRGHISALPVAIKAGTELRLSQADFLNTAAGAKWRQPLVATRAAKAAISPDGKYVATASADGQAVELFSVKTGERLQKFAEHQATIRGIAFSPQGERLATCAGDDVLVWDVAIGKRVLKITQPETPSGGGIGGVIVNLALAPILAPLSLLGPHGNLESVVFSSDGNQLLTSQFEGAVRQWDVRTGTQTRQFCGRSEPFVGINMAAYSADGKHVVAADCTGFVRAWETATGWQTLRIRADEKWVASAQFSPDGKHILTLGADDVARVWNAMSGEHLHLFHAGEEGKIRQTCFTPDGIVLTVGDDRAIRRWDPSTGKELGSVVLFPPLVSRTLLIASLSDDTFLTNGLLGYQLRDVQTGNLERLFAE